MSSMNGDAQIAREWASKALDNVFLNEVPIEGYRAAARYILATTTPPTMADVDWDDDVHAGLCAEHEDYGTVRMLCYDPHDGGAIICHWIHSGSPVAGDLLAEKLTPLPGTRLDLAPRREPEPESTPDHPAVLTIEAEYLNAPAGTIVEGALTWAKGKDGCWETFGVGGGCSNSAVAGEARRVLRWGREA